MRLATSSGIATMLAAPPPPDRFDPAGDGGFAAALSDVMAPPREATPARSETRPKEATRPDAPKRDTAPAEAERPVEDPASAAAIDAKAAALAAETEAENAALAEIAITETAAAEPAEPKGCEPKDGKAKPKKTGQAETTPDAPGMVAMPLQQPAAAPATTESAAPAPTGSGHGEIAIAGLAPADIAGEPAAESPTAEQPGAEPAPVGVFAQEMARQTSQTAAPKLEAPAPPAAAAPAEQVAVKLATAANGKGDRIRIQLSPEALGRVDVQLDLGEDGEVKAVIRADKPETLHLLMHDAKHLVRGLQDAGFQASAGNLQFSLSGDNDARRQPSPYADAGEQPGRNGGARDDAMPAPAYRTLGRAAHGGIDLSI